MSRDKRTLEMIALHVVLHNGARVLPGALFEADPLAATRLLLGGKARLVDSGDLPELHRAVQRLDGVLARRAADMPSKHRR